MGDWESFAAFSIKSVLCCCAQCIKVAETRLPSVYRVPELIPVLGSQPAGDVNHKPDGRLPLLSARPAVTTPPPANLKRAATNFAAW